MGGIGAIFGQIGGNLWADKEPGFLPARPYGIRLAAIAEKCDKYRRYDRYCIRAAALLDVAAALTIYCD